MSAMGFKGRVELWLACFIMCMVLRFTFGATFNAYLGMCTCAVADAGFPRGGALIPKGGGCQPIIWPIFPINCMKIKKFWAAGARVPCAPP